jgi:beta-glucanase (GH16 family)
MKRYALLPALTLAACNPNKTALDASFHPTERDWVLAWSDEFDPPATLIDPGKWVTAAYCGGFNHEEQCYTPNNVAIRPGPTAGTGHLIITARKEQCHGTGAGVAAGNNSVGWVSCPPNSQVKTFNYSSGQVHSRIQPQGSLHSWKYGRIEIRAKLPYGKGTWAAFWMMPQSEAKYGGWPQSGEIDILEAVNLRSPNQSGDQVQANVHLCSLAFYTPNPHPISATPCPDLDALPGPANLPSYKQVHGPQALMLAPDGNCWPDLSGQFHTYAVEWSDADLRFFLDDKLIGSHIVHGEDDKQVAPFREPFYLILNLAVGGDMPNGNPPHQSTDTATWRDGATPNPKAELVLDWVRVYSCGTDPNARKCIYKGTGLGAKPVPVQWQPVCGHGIKHFAAGGEAGRRPAARAGED